MKPFHRRTRLALAALAALVALAAAVYLTRGFWFRQIRSYYIGSAYVAAEDCTVNLPGIDRVDVLLLSGLKESVHKLSSGDLGDYEISQRVECDAAQAQHLGALWRRLPRVYGPSFITLCHDPVYGLRFWRGGKPIFETTVCWKCGNFTLPTLLGRAPYPFDAKHESSQQILAELRFILPEAAPAAPDS